MPHHHTHEDHDFDGGLLSGQFDSVGEAHPSALLDTLLAAASPTALRMLAYLQLAPLGERRFNKPGKPDGKAVASRCRERTVRRLLVAHLGASDSRRESQYFSRA